MPPADEEKTMKAFVLRSYGSPELLDLADLDKPVPAEDEVLVQVRATSINPYDWHLMRGQPYVARLMPGGLGLRSPRIRILGCDLAGRVEAVGQHVTSFAPGDEVFGLLPGGGFGEYVSVQQSLLAPKPANLSYEQAAAVPMAAITALLGLRDAGQLKPGQTVLVNGASGGVGTFAVQIARALGATVTGVCSTPNLELVRSLGAAEVIDYTAQDFTRPGQRYDLLLDITGSRPVQASRRALKPKGTFVAVGGPPGRWLHPADHVFAALALAPLVSQRMVLTDTAGSTEHQHNLVTLTELIEGGTVTPVIDRSYRFAEIPAAIRYQEQGHSRGKVVVTVHGTGTAAQAQPGQDQARAA
jgi:NADPH:quinone reductase-like Zn-dependent oxidoreductase